MKTEAEKEKEKFVLSVVMDLFELFQPKLTDMSKKLWIEELVTYDRGRILKTKKLLQSSHRGFLYPSHFHEAITNFKKDKPPLIEEQPRNPIPMPESFKKKYLRMRKEWEK